MTYSLRNRAANIGPRQRRMTYALVALAALLAELSAPAHAQSAAGSVTYNVNQTIANGTVVGQIVTDGKTGTLTQSDIVSWNLNLNGVGATAVLTIANSGVHLIGANVAATNKNLTFNFSGTDGGYLLFQPSFGSGSQYYCNNTNWYGCKPGASVVPQSYADASAQYAAQSGVQTIGVAAIIVPVDAINSSFIVLRNSRTGQMLVYNTQGKLLTGKNEQINCSNCGGGYITIGSAELSSHGRIALSPELTLLGGVTIGKEQQRDSNIDLSVGGAAALRFDPATLGSSRPYFEVGLAASYQNVTYARRYNAGSALATTASKTHSYNVSTHATVGWVDRLSKRDEASVSASVTKIWQGVSSYRETTDATNPFPATVPGSVDQTAIAALDAQYTHLFGKVLGLSVEVNLNAELEHTFSGKSGISAQVGDMAIHPDQPDFTYYEIGGRLGIRLAKFVTLDVFVNTILAPTAIGSSTRGGFGLRANF